MPELQVQKLEAIETVINLIKPSVRENVAVILLTLSSMSPKPSEIKIKASKTIIVKKF